MPYADSGTPWGAIIGLAVASLVVGGVVVYAAVYAAMVTLEGRPKRLAERADNKRRLDEANARYKAKREGEA